jgi:hypothetical protein
VGLLALLAAVGMAIKLAYALTAFSPQDAPIGYIAQDEMTNFNLKSGREVLFRGEYEREFWSGTLVAYPVNASGDIGDKSGHWSGDAGALLESQDFDTGRLIATMKDDGTKIAFRWNSLSGTQQGLLTSEAVLNYVRGDRSNETTGGGTMRQRATVFGDVIHSRPLYVADATNPTVFVGANDGMLHAINAGGSADGGGQERWAYVPSMLLPKVKTLTVDPYVHNYFVDGQINVGTILSGTKRVLVGGLGAGGKGLYALDITGSAGLVAANETALATKALWELTPTKLNYANPTTTNAYINLGYTYGTVNIAKVGGEDAVIVGNGFNDGQGSYAGCTHGTPNYANCGGNYAAYLYVINANTGQLISAIKAGANGTAASPNGLSTPVAVDSDGDGSVDRVFAGDLNGTMWKFDLVAGTSAALLTTSPAQAITSTPGVALHPEGGYMVNFVTGKMLVTADTTDNTVHYAYGVWDSAPAANDTLLVQTLSERNYTLPDGVTVIPVRRVTSNQPVFTAGAGNHRGWKVALPAGERVTGEGSFIENGRFYFMGHNPTVPHLIPNTTSTVYGDNWQMELDYLTGGSKNDPFLDLSGNVKLDDADRIKYIAADTRPVGREVGDAILTTDGIPVGKYLGIGIFSQPILVQLLTLNDTLYNQNPDIVVPSSPVERGVAGGHFDVEIFYGSTPGAQATARITVGSTGQAIPATLGAISVNGVQIMPALTVAALVNGTSTSTNAEAIRSRVTNGFSAVRSSNVVVIKAPAGASYNGMSLTIGEGTTQAAVPAVPATRPTALITFSGGPTANTDPSAVINDSLSKSTSVRLGSTAVDNDDIDLGRNASAATAAQNLADAIGTGGTVKAYRGGNSVTPICQAQTTSTVCLVHTGKYTNGDTPTLGSISATRLGTMTITRIASAGGTEGSPASPGWSNLKGFLTTTTFSGGADVQPGDTCSNGTARCSYKVHEHEYDDLYDKTGMNFLDPGNANYNIAKAIPSTSTPFKVLVANQYLNPAVKLHLGDSGYRFNVDAGYVPVKNYQTSATLDVTTLPTYTRANVGSFAFNMPVNAFTPTDWWGGVNGLAADVRVGLLPTEPRCVWRSSHNVYDGNMYQPVNPAATVTADGNGTLGYSSSTTALTATGVRHNGAIVFQVIKDTTPNDAIELSVAGRPEYGWRVKSAFFATYVLVEYTAFWHTKHLNLCYGEPGWTKLPGPDNRPCGGVDTQFIRQCDIPPAPTTGTAPLIGTLGGGGGTVTSVTTTSNAAGNVTTTVIIFSNTLRATIVRTANDDGSVTIVTTDTSGVVTRQTIANSAGSVRSGGDERGLQAKTGRISWRELVAP